MNVKPNRTFSWYLENRIFYLYLVFFAFYFSLIGFPIFRNRINTTFDWNWFLTSVDAFLSYYTLLFYFIGSLILLLLRKNTNKILTKFFLLSLILIFLYDGLYGMNYLSVGYFKLAIFLLFLIIFFQSLFRKK